MSISTLTIFLNVGLSREQANKIISYYQKNFLSPFERLNVAERLDDFHFIFGALGKTKKEINAKLVQFPSLLFNNPFTLEENISNVSRHFEMSTKDWLNIAWSNPTLLSKNGSNIDHILEEQAAVLNITKEEWQKKAFKKPAVLSISAELIQNNILINANQFGLSVADWTKTAVKDPELLYSKPTVLLQKIQQNAITFQTTVTAIVHSFQKYPALFYMDPNQTQKKYLFIIQMYLKDLFQLKDGGKKDPLVLKNYLLKNPLYIRSLKSLQRRCIYARYLIFKMGKAGMNPLWRTNKAIEETLAQAPLSFHRRERSLRISSFLKATHERD